MSRVTAVEVSAWCGGSWSGEPPTGFETVSTDSRTLSTGALYVALVGERYDGHEFVGAALRAGAGAAVVQAGFSVEGAAPLLYVADTRQALRDLAAGYRQKVSPRIIGITGSVGKSTVKELVVAILGQTACTSATLGNWNNAIGLPLSLLAMAPATEFGVFEIGTNHPGELADLCDLLQPDWGVVTNIGLSHLEHFGSEAAVAAEKGVLLECLPCDGVAFLDSDGPFFDVLRQGTAARVVSVALDREADLWFRKEGATPDTVMVEDRRARETFVLPRMLPGTHQVRNLLISVAVAREAGLGWDVIRAGVEAFKPMPMRWAVQQVHGVTVVNDAYNANPISMRAALSTFRDMPVNGKRWLVLGDMLELGDVAVKAHAALGQAVAEDAWAGLVTVGTLAENIAQAARRAGWRGERAQCGSALEAGAWLRERLSAGDAVLLKGSRGMRLEVVLEAIED